MDTKTPSDLIETVEAPFMPTNNPVVKIPVVPEWPTYGLQNKKQWNLFTPILNEYYNVIDNPKRLPTVFQTLISKERAFTFGGQKPSYYNFQVHVPDEHGVSRRLYFNVCKENFVVGAFGAALIGISTRHFMASPGSPHNFIAQRFLMGKPVSAFTRIALNTGMIATSVCRKLATRTVAGGLLYDLLKRSGEENYNHAHWMNAGISGCICGLLFGIKGGLPHAWVAAAVCSAGAVLSEFIPNETATN